MTPNLTENSTGSSTEPTRRRSELDVVRAFVVIGLIFFHAALVFDSRDDFYVKNPETTDVVMIFIGLGVVWAMPLLFLIAGVGSWHSLHRRGPAGYARERLLRLGVPLLVATVTIVPIPQWLRLKSDPGYDESYLRFLPRFFDVHLDLSEFPFVVQGEHFETGHLWFVVLLLAFSLLLAPVAAGLPHEYLRRVRDRLAAGARRRGTALLPAIPVAVLSALVGLEEAFAGWSRWAYLLFFLYGVIVATDERFRAAIRRDALPAAALGIGLFLVGMPAFMSLDDPFTDMSWPAAGARAVYGAAGWCWLTAILGLLDRRSAAATGPKTPSRRRLLDYMTTASLPLYVLHQPIVVAVAYRVVRWEAPMALKYAVIVAVSLALTVAAYDLLVRRTGVTRVLFGIRR